jgi:hypothetical protein
VPPSLNGAQRGGIIYMLQTRALRELQAERT